MIPLTFIGAAARRRDLEPPFEPGPLPLSAMLLESIDELADPTGLQAEDGSYLELE
jgi:hypothetical protein